MVRIVISTKEVVKEQNIRSKRFYIKKYFRRKRAVIRAKKPVIIREKRESIELETCFGCRLKCLVVVYNRKITETGKDGLFIYCEEFGYLQMYHDYKNQLKIKKNWGVNLDCSSHTNK